MKRLTAFFLSALLLITAVPLRVAAYTDFAPSEAIITFIANQEGFRAYAHSSGGRSYIGYGTQVRSGAYPSGITREAARELLKKDVSSYTYLVNRFFENYGITVTQYQFDAIVSLCYNVSSRWLNRNSEFGAMLIRGVEQYSDREVMNAFGSFCHANGRVLTGLVRRRLEEGKIFLYGDYGDLNAVYYADAVAANENALAAERAAMGEEVASEETVLLPTAPVYADGAAREFTYVLFDGGKGAEDADVLYFPKGKPYTEFPSAYRKGYSLAAWAKEDGTYLLPTAEAWSPVSVTAVYTQKTPERKYLSVSPYRDVSAFAWYYDGLCTATKAGIVSGFSSGNFRPKDAVSVGAVLKMVLLASGYGAQAATKEGALGGYKDLALAYGLVTEEEVRNIAAPATRLFVARVTARALGLTPSDEPSPFADENDPLATALYETGIMVGSEAENGTTVLLGDRSVRRLEMAVVATRILQRNTL